MNYEFEPIRIFIRVRPFFENENYNFSSLYFDKNDDQKLILYKSNNKEIIQFICYKIFFYNSTQTELYNYFNFIPIDIFNGINTTLLLYGQTGTGKTYTLFGTEWTNNSMHNKYILDENNFIRNNVKININDNENNGILIRLLKDIYKYSNFKLYFSYFQIYNEKIYDLLNNEKRIHKKPFFRNNIAKNKDFSYNYINNIYNNNISLHIREDKNLGIFIEGLTEKKINNLNEIIELLKKGEIYKNKRKNYKNELSNRSHIILMFHFISNKPNKYNEVTQSRLILCDLAGTEKLSVDRNYNKIYFNELININKSLNNLGIIIENLNKKKNYIPFRNSILTQFLQNSLGRNTKTHIISTISPSVEDTEETFNTLKFCHMLNNNSIIIKLENNENNFKKFNFQKNLKNEINSYRNNIQKYIKKNNSCDIFPINYNLNNNNVLSNYNSENEILRNKIITNKKKEKANKDYISIKNLNKFSNLAINGYEILNNNNKININNNINSKYYNYLDNYNDNKRLNKNFSMLYPLSRKLKELDELSKINSLNLESEISKIKFNKQINNYKKRKYLSN